MRGEIFTTKVVLENRAYFFNVKENRMGDVFLQVVESKSKNGEDFDRHAIVIFADEMQQFCKGLDESLSFIEKEKKKIAASPKIIRKKTQPAGVEKKDSVSETERPHESKIKRTGKVHVVAKKK